MIVPEEEPTKTINALSSIKPSEAIPLVAWTLSQLTNLGVCVPQGNRLQRAKQFIEEINVPGFTLRPEDEALQRRIIDANLSIYEQYVITQCFVACNRKIEERIKFKLQVMLGGADKEGEDRNSKARDTQFELYVASNFMMGGVPIKFGEPDLHIYYGDELVGVAIKRLKSPQKLIRRVKEAVKQIVKSGRRGFIAANLDIFLKNVRPAKEDADRFTQFDENNTPLLNLEPLLGQNPLVLGIFVFETSAGWIFTGCKPRMVLSHFRRFVSYFNDPREREFNQAFVNDLKSNISKRLISL